MSLVRSLQSVGNFKKSKVLRGRGEHHGRRDGREVSGIRGFGNSCSSSNDHKAELLKAQETLKSTKALTLINGAGPRTLTLTERKPRSKLRRLVSKKRKKLRKRRIEKTLSEICYWFEEEVDGIKQTLARRKLLRKREFSLSGWIASIIR